MAKIDALLARVGDDSLRVDLAGAIAEVQRDRDFGLVFESHLPETVRLPQHPIRRGVKVAFRDGDDDTLYAVGRIAEGVASLVPLRSNGGDDDPIEAALDNLVVVAEFGDPIHPGLEQGDSIRRGGDKRPHVVINGENHHVLEALQFTHAGKVDAIYIDPPYNSGARDWKYNNDYVEGDDLYRHSKWLAFMERRLLLAKDLLNPEESVLIVTIDEKEVHRLGLLLEQLFPEGDIQTVTTVTNPAGSLRTGRFTRVEEYIFYVFVGAAVAGKWTTRMMDGEALHQEPTLPTVWFTAVRRGGGGALRANRTTPVLFYPIHLTDDDGSFHSVGDPLPMSKSIEDYEPPPGTIAMWPLHADGTEQTWRFSGEQMRQRFKEGTVRLGRRDPSTGLRSVTYLQPGTLKKIETGELKVVGRADDGSLELAPGDDVRSGTVPPAAVWRMRSHFARDYGTGILKAMLPGTTFPFPKSVYAVEDTLRVAVGNNPDAVVLDFFAGSGTTAHAVMRLNKQDDGRRQSISVTNNEVSAREATVLRRDGFSTGDAEWEAHGIFEHVTQPRITAAVTGLTPDGKPVEGDYKFTDLFPMADGFAENVEFFSLTYEDSSRVELDMAFDAIAPLLWLRAGGVGDILTRPTGKRRRKRYVTSATYGVLFDLDHWRPFVDALADTVDTVFLVTDSVTEFAQIAGEVPTHVRDRVRLYERYLTTFAINGRPDA